MMGKRNYLTPETWKSVTLTWDDARTFCGVFARLDLSIPQGRLRTLNIFLSQRNKQLFPDLIGTMPIS